ncbi:hypothetical protein ABZP36_027946 [Zizania latifolia]
MASPRSAGGGVSGVGGAAATAGDEAIWRKLQEASFDEKSIKRRDKAVLISYISRLKSEVIKEVSCFDWVSAQVVGFFGQVMLRLVCHELSEEKMASWVLRFLGTAAMPDELPKIQEVVFTSVFRFAVLEWLSLSFPRLV